VLFLRVPLPLALAAVECWRPHTGRYARRRAVALLDQVPDDRGGLLDVAAADEVRFHPEFNVETGTEHGVVIELGVAQIALEYDEDREAGGVEAGELVTPSAVDDLGAHTLEPASKIRYTTPERISI